MVIDAGFRSAERIRLDENSWIEHVHGWLDGHEHLMRLLMDTASWEQRSRWMYNRTVQEPRHTAEYPVIAEAPRTSCTASPTPCPPHYGRPYTRLWMNWYRDHNDGAGWHADRPQHKLVETVIPVLGLGATRRFLIKPDGSGRSTVIETRGGDLVVMGGRSQTDYKHCVPKQKTVAGPRLSLNFSTEVNQSVPARATSRLHHP
ncbi:alpha-ketoglutarate-dependent dioxygenase AlkB [Rhodococcus olei]|uniref:alpha-ketoglutarate-dependent dioxygenase AlkB n=1 Tax=Rhodococcus olei TaxID=2161675 RepID=UPI0031EFDDE7